MKAMANQAVALPKNVAAPRLPKKAWPPPPPPNAPASPPPRPDCKSTTRISEMQTMTCMTMKKVNTQGSVESEQHAEGAPIRRSNRGSVALAAAIVKIASGGAHGADDPQKILGLQAGAPNQRPVYVGLGQEGGCVVWFDATAIQDACCLLNAV